MHTVEITLEQVLLARDRRVQRQKALTRQFGGTLLSFTMNIAGPVKDAPLVRLAFQAGLAALDRDLGKPVPRKIIDLSPFHTSMFITNLASIKTSYIHHHCYEFGTTSVFVCMGKPVPNYISGDLTKKMMPIGVVMDERICTGYEYAAFCNDFRRYMRLPRMLEYPFCQEEPAKEPSQETAAV